jgi:hypothetical protein
MLLKSLTTSPSIFLCPVHGNPWWQTTSRPQRLSPFAILGFIDYLGFLGEIGHPLLGERSLNDATG